MTDCAMPACNAPTTTANRAGQATCDGHRAVVVDASYLGEGTDHRATEADE